MIRIAMLGCDSSHTEAYCSLVNLPGSPFAGRARIVKIWGLNGQEAAHKARDYGVLETVGSPREAIRGVDAVMVVNRYGDEHHANALVALKAGLPTFIDKPMTNSLIEAKHLVTLAKMEGVPIMACSPYRHAEKVVEFRRQVSKVVGVVISGTVSGPGYFELPDPRSRHPFFYGIHLTEIATAVFGPGVERVAAWRGTRADIATLVYPDTLTVCVHFLRVGQSYYHAVVYGSDGWAECSLTETDSIYPANMAVFLDMVESGVPPTPLDQLLEPLATMEAIDRSMSEGRPIGLNELLGYAS